MQNIFSENYDLLFYLQIVTKKKWFLIVPLFLGLLGSFIFIYYSKPVFESRTIVRVGNQRILSRSVERVVPGARGIGTPNLLRRQILKYDNIQLLISSLNLKNDSDIEKINSEAKKIKAEYPEISVEEITDVLLVENLKEDFTIKLTGRQFIEIVANGDSPNSAYLLAKTLTDIFINSTLNEEMSGIRSSLDFSEDQLEIYKKKLEVSEKELEKYKQKLAVNQTEDYLGISNKIEHADSLIACFDVSIRQTEIELKNTDAKLDKFLKNLNFPESENFKETKKQLISSIQKLSNLSMKFSWRSGEVVRLNREIVELRGKMNELAKNIAIKKLKTNNENQIEKFVKKQTLLLEVDILYRKKAIIENLRGEYRNKLEDGPSIGLTLNRLEQEVGANRAIYDLFLQQTRGANIEQSLQREEAEYKLKIIEPAKKPITPIRPNKKMIIIIGLFLGLLSGCSLIFGLNIFDFTYKDVMVMENELQLPVLGIVPKLESMSRRIVED